jgi:multicomponent Na+:H+ antiporter subunit D
MNIDSNLLAAPILIPLVTASLILLISRWGGRRRIRLQKALTSAGVAANLAVAITLLITTLNGHRLVLQMGGWSAPFGITVYGDALSTLMLTLTGVVTAAVLPFAMATIDYHRERLGFYPLFLVLLMGVNGAFLAGDLFNLYVFFEVLLMASFVLLTLGGRLRQTSGGIRYVLLNLLASVIFLTAAGITYGTLGTLNMAHIAQRISGAPMAVQTLLGGLLLVAFGSKAALFPLFFWLPSSYHTPPPAVTALFGGLLTKVGVYALFRTFPLFFPGFLQEWQTLLLLIAGFTMLVGALGAMAQPTIRRILSFHIINHVGYMLMGLAVATSGNQLIIGFGMAAAVLYLMHHMIVKTALLMAGGVIELDSGSGRLDRIGGLARRRPILAGLFFLAAISLAGIPPFSGFVSKLGLLQSVLDSRHWLTAGVSVFASILTLINVMRIWQDGFWGTYAQPRRLQHRVLTQPAGRWMTLAPIAVLLTLSLTIGLFGEAAFSLSMRSAAQALDREAYIAAVHPQVAAAAGEMLPTVAEHR